MKYFYIGLITIAFYSIGVRFKCGKYGFPVNVTFPFAKLCCNCLGFDITFRRPVSWLFSSIRVSKNLIFEIEKYQGFWPIISKGIVVKYFMDNAIKSELTIWTLGNTMLEKELKSLLPERSLPSSL